MKKVYIVNGSAAYRMLFASLGFVASNNLNDAHLVVFTGGEDVTPGIYGDAPHKYTGNNVYRDQQEARIFEQAAENGTPMVGICRGGQFLNVMSGGRMYQHVTNHAIGGLHLITDTRTGETVYVTSTHHQMFMPSPEALVVATAHLGGTREWYDQEIFRKDTSEEDIEVVYYKNTKCLCFQPHPEFNGKDYQPMKDYFAKILLEFFGL